MKIRPALVGSPPKVYRMPLGPVTPKPLTAAAMGLNRCNTIWANPSDHSQKFAFNFAQVSRIGFENNKAVSQSSIAHATSGDNAVVIGMVNESETELYAVGEQSARYSYGVTQDLALATHGWSPLDASEGVNQVEARDFPVSSYSYSGGFTTLDLDASLFYVGQTVQVANVVAAVNGGGVITATTPTSITYAISDTGSGSGGAGGTAGWTEYYINGIWIGVYVAYDPATPGQESTLTLNLPDDLVLMMW